MSEISRLRWRCRRGMKELDVVLSRYLDSCYDKATPDDQRNFRTLLEMPDPDLYALILGRSTAEEESMERFVTLLRGLKK